jgi:hypothetical protein
MIGLAAAGTISIFLALTLPVRVVGIAGYLYTLIGVV